ncbi:hypothetical protein DPMN_102392 [Dreissena polymorpha]|uniref:Uncharacterized protein n=1 Tax=Dreissena polymorpha TaxID=45954 RepID=A0A9D4RAU2_DREPO|nr:hypothetical protein DPMN_102392 [Dreissena polymorpha]
MDENAMFEEDDFVSVAEENGNSINAFLECDNLMSFMNRSKVIYARSSTIEDADRDVFCSMRLI